MPPRHFPQNASCPPLNVAHEPLDAKLIIAGRAPTVTEGGHPGLPVHPLVAYAVKRMGAPDTSAGASAMSSVPWGVIFLAGFSAG